MMGGSCSEDAILVYISRIEDAHEKASLWIRTPYLPNPSKACYWCANTAFLLRVS
jgi:hypothetical protein